MLSTMEYNKFLLVGNSLVMTVLVDMHTKIILVVQRKLKFYFQI